MWLYLIVYKYPSKLHMDFTIKNFMNDFIQMTDRFRKNHINLFEVLVYLKDKLSLKGLHVYNTQQN